MRCYFTSNKDKSADFSRFCREKNDDLGLYLEIFTLKFVEADAHGAGYRIFLSFLKVFC